MYSNIMTCSAMPMSNYATNSTASIPIDERKAKWADVWGNRTNKPELEPKTVVEKVQLVCPEPKLSQEEKKVSEQMIPDVSLSRVFKWAIVLVIAMALGRRVWDMFGDKITKGFDTALDHLNQSKP
jgi:hypothetical protein